MFEKNLFIMCLYKTNVLCLLEHFTFMSSGPFTLLPILCLLEHVFYILYFIPVGPFMYDLFVTFITCLPHMLMSDWPSFPHSVCDL